VLDEAGWTRFCEANGGVKEWIGNIQATKDVNSVLRLALYELFDEAIESQFSRHDLRADELPETLPVMNLRTMTGGE
jgi:hypothetical protein